MNIKKVKWHYTILVTPQSKWFSTKPIHFWSTSNKYLFILKTRLHTVPQIKGVTFIKVLTYTKSTLIDMLCSSRGGITSFGFCLYILCVYIFSQWLPHLSICVQRNNSLKGNIVFYLFTKCSGHWLVNEPLQNKIGKYLNFPCLTASYAFWLFTERHCIIELFSVWMSIKLGRTLWIRLYMYILEKPSKMGIF